MINTAVQKENVKERIENLISQGIVVNTYSAEEFVSKASYYSFLEDVETIYAVGGDGTVNLLANIIVNTKKKMGIIPIGTNNYVYRSIRDECAIDIGYMNNQVFLNHAVAVSLQLHPEDSPLSRCLNYELLPSFEFVTNIRGKYEILSSNAIVITNGGLGHNPYSLVDGKMEVSFLRNKLKLFRRMGKQNPNIVMDSADFEVDFLDTVNVVIDGDLYSLEKFSFKMGKEKILISRNDIGKRFCLSK